MRRRAIVTVVFLAATLTACGGDSDTSGSDDPPTSEATSDATSEATSDAATATETETTPPDDEPETTPPDDETESSESASGGGSGSDYCDELKSARSELSGLNFERLGDDQFEALNDQLDDLAEVAPAAVKDDWLTVGDALKRVRDILAGAGLTFGDLQNLDPTNLPQGVTVKDLERLGKQLQEFSLDTDFQEAAMAIGKSAKAECGVAFLG